MTKMIDEEMNEEFAQNNNNLSELVQNKDSEYFKNLMLHFLNPVKINEHTPLFIIRNGSF